MYSDDHLKAIRSQEIPGRPSPKFVEIPPFGARWSRLGLTDADQHFLQNVILANPAAGAVIAGTNGLRKVRFAAPGRAKGKSGSFRAFYLNVAEHGLVALWAVIDKTEDENLTRAEREVLRDRVAAFLKVLDERSGR